jgi:hypothetical protein
MATRLVALLAFLTLVGCTSNQPWCTQDRGENDGFAVTVDTSTDPVTFHWDGELLSDLSVTLEQDEATSWGYWSAWCLDVEGVTVGEYSDTPLQQCLETGIEYDSPSPGDPSPLSSEPSTGDVLTVWSGREYEVGGCYVSESSEVVTYTVP